MKIAIKRIFCVVMLLMVTMSDVGYIVWAAQNECKQTQEHKNNPHNGKIDVKKMFNESERKEIAKRAYDKIENDENLNEEEILVIDSQYDDMEIILPSEEVEWEVDHEKGIGTNEGIMTLASSVVEDALYRNKKTTVVEVGSIPRNNYDNGEGDLYCFSDYVKSSFIMPGMKQTSLGDSTCSRMIPQGICHYGGYIFITAYCEDETHNSVIYVLNTSGKYITTLVTDAVIHAGGIVYANGYLWIGDTDNSIGYLYYYNYSQIKETIKRVF